jgi:hypothetical protein
VPLNRDKQIEVVGDAKGIEDTTGNEDRAENLQRLYATELLAKTGEIVRTYNQPDELFHAVSQAIGEYFDLSRCFFSEIDLENTLKRSTGIIRKRRRRYPGNIRSRIITLSR